MPVTKSAKKKLRQDIKREKENKKLDKLLRATIKEVGRNASTKSINQASKTIDKAVKKHIIHSNKGARLKSKLSKLVSKTGAKKTPKTVKKASKK